MFNLNFIAFAINKKGRANYEDFLIPFTLFALLYNENSHVEIIVVNPNAFKQKYIKELEELKKINNHFLIREPQYKLNKHIPNTYRFFEVPTVKSNYTLISDIDIMYLENILPLFLKKWPLSGNFPYSNVRRPNTNRLTGVMMVNTKKYYTNTFKKCQRKYYNKNNGDNDEVILGKMCDEIHGYAKGSRFITQLGIHFSPNRSRNSKIPLKANENMVNKFLEMIEKYNTLCDYPIFKKLVNNLNDKFNISISKIKQTSNDDQDKQV